MVEGYELTGTAEDWLWDPFNFETGVIREYEDIFIDGTKTVAIIGSAMPVVPVITVQSENSDGMDLVYLGEVYHLTDGANRIVTMTLTEGEYQFTFIGDGYVSVEFREGSL